MSLSTPVKNTLYYMPFYCMVSGNNGQFKDSCIMNERLLDVLAKGKCGTNSQLEDS